MIKNLGIETLNNGAVTAPFHEHFLSVVFNQMMQGVIHKRRRPIFPNL